MKDPTTKLPRDMTGSYLHLKLKRFPSLKTLTMPYAKKLWKQIPHDAEVDVAATKRSKCRQCHNVIEKGDLRMRLWLQCHAGCKMSAYFHGVECFWKYPESIKLTDVVELHGLEKLSKGLKNQVESDFRVMLAADGEEKEEPKKKKRKT